MAARRENVSIPLRDRLLPAAGLKFGEEGSDGLEPEVEAAVDKAAESNPWFGAERGEDVTL